jgi:PAS domain S-box-containing protein
MVDERTKLLLIEDDKIDQLAFERFVKSKRLSYDYSIADSVKSAKEAISSENFETIIADYYLGDGDAIDILSMGVDAPIIITTGAGSEEIAVKAIKAGAYDYLIKDSERNYLKVLPATVDNAIRNKQTRDLLKHAEESYKDLYERVPIGLYRTEPGGRILMANPKFIGMLGYDTFNEISRVIAAELFVGGTEEREELLELLEEKGELHSHEFKLRKRDGTEITVRGSVKVMRGIMGETLYYEGALEDISERIKVDEILKMMHRAMEASLDGILITDPRVEDNPIIYCNPAFLRITGYDKDEVMFRNCGFLQGNDKDQDGVYQIRKAVKTGTGCHVVLRNYTKDGAMFWNELSLAPVLNMEGEVINFVGIIKDVSERVKMDEEIIKRQKLDSLSVLAGGIAHDLNNLLTTILGNVSMARKLVKTDDKSYNLLFNSEKACERVSALTRQLLTFAKGGEPVKDLVSISNIIYGALLLAPMGTDVNYQLDLPQNLWNAELDEGQITQVLSNVLINAIQAMPVGGTIHISAENVEHTAQAVLPGRLRGGEYVRVVIRDEGVGIPNHLANKIFDPYFTTKKEGHGLGLAAAHSIIRNHGGDIGVESKVGEGTTFTIYLPAKPSVIQPTVQLTNVSLAGKRGHILILEDEAAISLILKEMLEQLGCTVETAYDGQEAIDLYRDAMDSSKPFDVVMMDLRIEGGMGGKEALARIKELDTKVKAIASSGYFEESFASNYTEYGFKAILAKPYTIEELIQILNRLL